MSDNNGQGSFVLYHYTPSLAGAVIFVALFILGAIAHIYLAARFRTRHFTALIIGCICTFALIVLHPTAHSPLQDPQTNTPRQSKH